MTDKITADDLKKILGGSNLFQQPGGIGRNTISKFPLAANIQKALPSVMPPGSGVRTSGTNLLQQFRDMALGSQSAQAAYASRNRTVPSAPDLGPTGKNSAQSAYESRYQGQIPSGPTTQASGIPNTGPSIPQVVAAHSTPAHYNSINIKGPASIHAPSYVAPKVSAVPKWKPGDPVARASNAANLQYDPSIDAIRTMMGITTDNAKNSDTDLQGIFASLQASIGKNKYAIDDTYHQGMANLNANTDNASTTIQNNYDASRAAQIADLEKHGLGQTVNNDANVQGANDKNWVQGLLQVANAGNQGQLNSNLATAQTANMQSQNNAGFEGANRRSDLMDQLSSRLYDLGNQSNTLVASKGKAARELADQYKQQDFENQSATQGQQFQQTMSLAELKKAYQDMGFSAQQANSQAAQDTSRFNASNQMQANQFNSAQAADSSRFNAQQAADARNQNNANATDAYWKQKAYEQQQLQNGTAMINAQNKASVIDKTKLTPYERLSYDASQNMGPDKSAAFINFVQHAIQGDARLNQNSGPNGQSTTDRLGNKVPTMVAITPQAFANALLNKDKAHQFDPNQLIALASQFWADQNKNVRS